jgi:hypothetical protein
MLINELFNSNSEPVIEGVLDNPGQEDSPVASAIIRRILLQRTDLLSKYGPERVGAAVDEVADSVGDWDEIGSSDVSGWVRRVEQMLGNMQEGIAEGNDHSLKKVWDRYSKHLQAGRGYHSDVRQIYKSGDILQNIRKYVKDHHGQKAVDDMERYAEKRQWDESVEEGDIGQLEKDIADAPVEPIANMEAQEKIGGRYDADDFDDMVSRLKKLAGAGPMKTVWDPDRRVYRNMPTAVQPAQQPKK